MGINVSTSMGFENRNFLRETAKQILQKGGAQEEEAANIAQNVALSYSGLQKAGIDSYRAAAQITLNQSLKETLKYLKAHANEKRKQHVFGELRELLGDYDSEDSYEGELLDFEIDDNLTNIFAA